MVSAKPPLALTPQPDEQMTAQSELVQYLAAQTQEITPDTLPSVFQDIRVYLRDVAFGAAQNVEQAAKAIVENAIQLGQMLIRMKTDLKRKEYKIFLSQIGWTPRSANKYIRLAKTFQASEASRLGRVELTTLLSLCTKTYTGVVEKLRDMGEVTQELVERLKKESRLHRSSSQQSTPITGWKRNSSGGGRQYVVRLVNEQVGIIVEKQAQAQGLLPHRVVEYTILRAQENQVVHPGDYTLAQMQELHETIEQMRSVQIEKERLEFKLRQMEVEKQAEITALQEKVQQLESRLAAAPEPPPSDPFVAPTEPPLIEQKDSDPLQQTKTWSEVAQITQCQGDSLLKAVKTWQIEEQKHLVNLLVAHLESVPEALDEAKWIPQKLLTKALSKLSYTICRIGGPNNLVDEPELEYISGCSLANLEYFGTRREQWIFEDSSKKRYPVFGRDEFAIERF